MPTGVLHGQEDDGFAFQSEGTQHGTQTQCGQRAGGGIETLLYSNLIHNGPGI